MDEKTVQRIKKLQALAERGVGGEKDTAAKILWWKKNQKQRDGGIMTALTISCVNTLCKGI